MKETPHANIVETRASREKFVKIAIERIFGDAVEIRTNHTNGEAWQFRVTKTDRIIFLVYRKFPSYVLWQAEHERGEMLYSSRWFSNVFKFICREIFNELWESACKTFSKDTLVTPLTNAHVAEVVDAEEHICPDCCKKNAEECAAEKDSEKRLVYIAGPMRGKYMFNFPAFDSERDRLKTIGYDVISPADLDREAGFDPEDCEIPENYDWGDLGIISHDFNLMDAIDRDVAALKECDAIYLLDGWQQSRGACGEKGLAEWLGLEIMYQTPNESILDEAKRITGGDRQASYGPANQDFARTAGIWTAYLNDILKEGCEINDYDVACMMIHLKTSRQKHQRKRDNWTDIAGYAHCGNVCDEADKERLC